MNEHWQEIERIFHAASELQGIAQAEFLAKACGEDGDLRREVGRRRATLVQRWCR